MQHLHLFHKCIGCPSLDVLFGVRQRFSWRFNPATRPCACVVVCISFEMSIHIFTSERLRFMPINAALGMRWEGLSSLMKPSVIQNAKRASAKGVKGNLKGEGRLLGGLLVVGGDGVAFEHREAVSKDFELKLNAASDHFPIFLCESFKRASS